MARDTLTKEASGDGIGDPDATFTFCVTVMFTGVVTVLRICENVSIEPRLQYRARNSYSSYNGQIAIAQATLGSLNNNSIGDRIPRAIVVMRFGTTADKVNKHGER